VGPRAGSKSAASGARRRVATRERSAVVGGVGVSCPPISGDAFQPGPIKENTSCQSQQWKASPRKMELISGRSSKAFIKRLTTRMRPNIVSPYLHAAVVCDLAPPLSQHGLDRESKQAWLDTWEGPIDCESRDFEITVSGDFAFCHGLYRLIGTSKAAGRPISFWVRATVCLHRDRRVWRIVHKHTSVPFIWMVACGPPLTSSPSGCIETREAVASGISGCRFLAPGDVEREGREILCSKLTIGPSL
jgi:ketosteroid isomerase-like protein